MELYEVVPVGLASDMGELRMEEASRYGFYGKRHIVRWCRAQTQLLSVLYL